MNKLYISIFSIFLIFLLIIGSIFLIPINLVVSNLLKNSDLEIQYSYLEGNIFGGRILDLYYENNHIGDFNYHNEFSLTEMQTKFISIDEKKIEGTVIKKLSHISDIDTFAIRNFSMSNVISTDFIKYVDVNLDVEEMEIIDSQCIKIIGILEISSQEIKEELIGKLACFESNTISAELFDKKNRELGNIAFTDSQAKVNISTKTIPDKRVQLLTDYISFTIDF